MRMNILNMEGIAPKKTVLGKGSFGTVIAAESGKEPAVVKRIYPVVNRHSQGFTPLLPNLLSRKERETYQYKLEKLMQELLIIFLLGNCCIVPCLINIDFSVITYEDSFEFAMEKCEPLDFRTLDLESFERDLVGALEFMHSIHIIHGDIKEQNILFSPRLKKYVFVDFGCSRVLREGKGQPTLINGYFGSWDYLSPEMLKVANSEDKKGFVDLYENDRHALRITLKRVSNQKIGNSSYSPIIFWLENVYDLSPFKTLC